MDASGVIERLESASRDVFGTGVAGWTATLRPLDHAEVTNDVWSGHLDGADVFVKRYTRPDRYVNESHALELARRAGLPVPEVRLQVDDLTVLVLTRLEGDLLATRWQGMGRPERHDICRLAGALAATLHGACRGTAFGARAAPGLVEGSAWLEFMTASLARWFSAVTTINLPFDWPAVEESLSRYLETESFAAPPCLTHVDISPRNLVIAGSAGGAVALGLLDWELARYDHPGMDMHNSMGAKWLDYDAGLVRSLREGVAAAAEPEEVDDLDRHHDFFKAIVSLSTLAYLARVGVALSAQDFLGKEVRQLRDALGGVSLRR